MQNESPFLFAVVTSASSGIGYELAKEFAAHGFDLLIASPDDSIRDAAESLRTSGAKIDYLQVDLGLYDGVEHLYRRMRSAGRPVDVLAINVGDGLEGSFLRTPLEDELNLIESNVTSTVHLAKRVASDMADRKEGRILFTAASASDVPTAVETVYGASIAFLLSFFDSLRKELKENGVDVAVLAPAMTNRRASDRVRSDGGVAVTKWDDPAELARMGYSAMMKSWTRPDRDQGENAYSDEAVQDRWLRN